MDPTTRVDALDDPMKLTYLGENIRGLTLEIFQHFQLWTEFEDRVIRGNTDQSFWELMSKKSPWVLNDSRFRALAERLGAV
ncbi:MAG: hypothetical protein ACI89U_000288 [Gammaproteobacteria bacterium]|jgi:hypothetical protein